VRDPYFWSRGVWVQNVDSGQTTVHWDRITWTRATPPSTTLSVRVRGADDEAAFTAGTVTPSLGAVQALAVY